MSIMSTKGQDTVNLCLLLLFIGFGAAKATEKDPSRPYDFLYKQGVEGYLENNWENCAKNLEEALADWHWWNANTARCRKMCTKESEELELLSASLSDTDRYYERAVRNTLCLVKCKKDVFGDRMDRLVEGNVRDDFELRKPYDYLQLCYYKMGRMKEAASAAATVLAVQPDHEVMANNLQYYVREGAINTDDVLNMELKEYGKEYILGTLAYDKGDYKATVTHMEKSLASYYEAYEDCRALCDSPFDQGWHPDFIASIANHFTFTLRCKRRCTWQLSDLYGDIDDDFYPSYFNYLQYSYYQLGDKKAACEAVQSYLTVSPEDETQNRNKQFYITQEKVAEDLFIPRKDVVAYNERDHFEAKFMEFIESNFSFLTNKYEDDSEDDEHKTKTVADTEAATNTSAVVDALNTTIINMVADNTNKVEL